MVNGVEFNREKYLDQSLYFSDSYFRTEQLFFQCEQIELLYKYTKLCEKPRILEIGKGNGLVSEHFKRANFQVQTFDINEALNPDIVGNIIDLNSLIVDNPDIVLCAEVLEHLDFKYFEIAIQQLSKTTKKYVILTIPEFNHFYGLNLQIRLPLFRTRRLALFVKSKHNKLLGSGHFWEIDSSCKTNRRKVENLIRKYFNIIEKKNGLTNPHLNYYVLAKT